jgi:hypothetical protein
MEASEFAGLSGPDFLAWVRQIQRLGGCASPIYLTGHTITRDAVSGEVLHVFTSASQPYGTFAVGCRNRRETVCLPCSYLHKGDTYQIVVSGLSGGKGVPEDVAAHPRLFATLTAPSFGPVHRAADPDAPRQVCRARRNAPVCAHGVSMACYARHRLRDDVVGAPLCVDCYDYVGAVLWNASVGRLWHRVVTYTGRELAKSQGLRVRELPDHARVSFAKVVEYQARGSVHIHAVIRCDGPDGPGDPAPGWASAAVLGDAVVAAVGAVRIEVPDLLGELRPFVFGAQLDVQEIGGVLDEVSDTAVAAYIAKYVTKGDDKRVVLASRLRSAGQIEMAPGLSEHGRRLMRTAWELSGLPQYAGLNLRVWAHQAGFRGHIATKSRLYSTTYGALRAARSAFGRSDEFEGIATVTDSVWHFDHVGHASGHAMVARGIAEGLAAARVARHRRVQIDAREARAGGWVV